MPKNVVCKKCNNLVNDWCEKVIDSPDQDMQRDCQYFCEKTNADRIRNMTDNELAGILLKFRNDEALNRFAGVSDLPETLEEIEKWLETPWEGKP